MACGISVTRMNGIAENSTRTLQAEDYLERLRRSVLHYVYDYDEASRKENSEVAAMTRSALQAAEQATPSEERKEKYRDVQALLASTQESTQLLFDTEKQIEAARPKLVKAGTDLVARSRVLIDKVKAGPDQSLTDLATKLNSQLYTYRIMILRAELFQNVDGKPAVVEALAKAKATVEALQAGGSENVRALVGPLKSELADYNTNFETLLNQLHKVRDLFANKITPQISQMQATIVKVRGELQQNFGETRTSVETSIADTVFNQKITGAIVLLIGVLIAFFTARSVSNPITALTKGMRELAQGNFGVMLPGLDRKDEIGHIAKAVDEFKVKAAEKAQREVVEKVEQDTRAEAERQAALTKMADEFQTTVGGIVQAAVAGDFSQRVDLEGKTGLVLNIGTAINLLCENVAKSLGDLIKMLNALAEGDLSQRITAEYQGNFAILKENANKTAERIGSTIGRDQGLGERSHQRLGGDFDQHDRSVAAHRGTGREPGRNLGLDGGNLGDREEERRERPAGQPVGQRRPATSPTAAARWSPRRSRPWPRSRTPRARSPTSSASSTRSPGRPTCWRSMPRWKRRAPAKPAAASRWWPRKCAAWRSAPRRPPRTSRT